MRAAAKGSLVRRKLETAFMGDKGGRSESGEGTGGGEVLAAAEHL